jgi:hypothetical protein
MKQKTYFNWDAVPFYVAAPVIVIGVTLAVVVLLPPFLAALTWWCDVWGIR